MFYVVGKGWVAAGDLTAGDKLCLESGKTVTVTGSELEKFEQPIKVYNLEVLDNHTYFVGDKAVLVHNDYGGNNNNGSNSGSNDTGGSGFDDAFAAADNYTLTDDQYNNHILPRHGSNSTYSNKCHFDANFDIKAEIDKLLKGDDFILKLNTDGRSGWIFEKTFSNPIGTDPQGRLINTLKVVIDEFGKVVTAFPKR